MLDWAILIGGIVVVLVGMWKGYRWLRQEPEPEETAVALPDGYYGFGSRMPPYPDVSPSAEDGQFSHRRVQRYVLVAPVSGIMAILVLRESP